MKILFIGGTGNISTECAALLHQRGHEILILSRGRSAVPPEYRLLQADRSDRAAMQAVLKGLEPDVVLNFIGYDLPEVQADFELFRGVTRQYVFISSVTVYAKPPRQLPMTEEAPVGNVWWDYAQKKLACEQWLRQRWEQDGFPLTIVRPSHTYSKRWIPNPIASSSFTYAARLEQGRPVIVPDNGENPWTLTAASDFAQGLAGLLGTPKAIGEAFQITSDEVLTWNQIVAEIAAALAEPRPIPPPQVAKIPTDFICQIAPAWIGNIKGDKCHPGVFDNSKIKRFVPEFRCRVPFRAGIRESVAWLRSHPEAQNLNPELDALIDEVIGAWRKNG
jgi:nucleoside-diphosphate-sugar epimerase